MFATLSGTALAAGTVTYTGQGFLFDGTTYNLNDERCGLEGQIIATALVLAGNGSQCSL